MISIFVPQNRPGGLDVLFAGLANQTLPRDQFELLLIDDLHTFRADQVREYAARYDLQVRHLPPHDVPKLPCGLYEQGHYQRALNTGLMHARGTHCLVLCDYTYLSHEALAQHALYHSAERDGLKICVMGLVDNVDIRPQMHPAFPGRYGWSAMGHHPADNHDGVIATSYEPWLQVSARMGLCREWFANYCEDLTAGKLEPFMWSVLAEPVTPETDIRKFEVYEVGRAQLNEGQCHHQICYLKNDSFSIDDLLAVGGWDEAFDGCHGHQDSELAGRLEKQLGMQFWLFKDVKATLFEPHSVAIIRQYRKPENHNLLAYSAKWESGEWTGGSALDLRKMREELRNGS